MAKIQDCPGFEPFGADVKAARKQMRLSRQKVAELLNISQFYLVNIENNHKIPSLPIIIQLIQIFSLSAEKYFNRPISADESEQRQRVSRKVQLCPEKYLPNYRRRVGWSYRERIEPLCSDAERFYFLYFSGNCLFSLSSFVVLIRSISRRDGGNGTGGGVT